jgi:hypothetical protein
MSEVYALPSPVFSHTGLAVLALQQELSQDIWQADVSNYVAVAHRINSWPPLTRRSSWPFS